MRTLGIKVDDPIGAWREIGETKAPSAVGWRGGDRLSCDGGGDGPRVGDGSSRAILPDRARDRPIGGGQGDVLGGRRARSHCDSGRSAQEGRPVVAARLDHVEVVGPIRQVELVAAGGVGDRLTGRGVVQGPQCEHPCPREWCPVAGVGEYSLDRSGGWRHGDLGLVGRRRCRLVGVHGRCHLQRAGGCSWMGATHLGARTGAQCPDHRFAGEAATADPDPRQGDGAGVADHEAVGHVIVGGSRKARRCQGCLQRIVRRREHERSGPSSRPGT